jgi:hypothetical protein
MAGLNYKDKIELNERYSFGNSGLTLCSHH